MIGAASAQIDELVDQLRLVARIESGSYEPVLAERDSLELAREAASRLDDDRVEVTGRGAAVLVDPEPTTRALCRLAGRRRASVGIETVALDVDGRASPSRRSALGPAGRARRGGP